MERSGWSIGAAGVRGTLAAGRTPLVPKAGVVPQKLLRGGGVLAYRLHAFDLAGVFHVGAIPDSMTPTSCLLLGW